MCKKKKWRLVNGKNEMDLRQMEQKRSSIITATTFSPLTLKIFHSENPISYIY